MDARAVIFCAFLSVCLHGVFGQVGSLCRANERLLSCGCPRTCRDPVPDCKGVCKEGCFCEDGQVRNEQGTCVRLADCPPIPLPYKLETSEPRLHGSCPQDEEYRFCEPCNRSCDNPNPICPAQCGKGCFCKGDLLRDKDGRCVKYEQCSNYLKMIEERDSKAPFGEMPARYSCGGNQQYKECQKCTQTCGDSQPVCGKCKTGCFCKDGFVKSPSGKCVRKEDCPKVSSTVATVLMAHFFSSVEDCSSSEEYYSCGWCEPTCQDPEPSCPDGCTRGCLCRPPTVRHANGLCVAKEQCSPKCSDPNEEYSCLFGCEKHCPSSAAAVSSCKVRRYPLRCVLGCHCRRGLFRDGSACVAQELCFRNNAIVVVK